MSDPPIQVLSSVFILYPDCIVIRSRHEVTVIGREGDEVYLIGMAVEHMNCPPRISRFKFCGLSSQLLTWEGDRPHHIYIIHFICPHIFPSDLNLLIVRSVLSGEKLTACTLSEWPSSTHKLCLQSAKFKVRSILSLDPATRRLSLKENAMDDTQREWPWAYTLMSPVVILQTWIEIPDPESAGSMWHINHCPNGSQWSL